MVFHDSQLMPINEIYLAHNSPTLNRNFNDNSLLNLTFYGMKRKHRYAQTRANRFFYSLRAPHFRNNIELEKDF